MWVSELIARRRTRVIEIRLDVELRLLLISGRNGEVNIFFSGERHRYS